MATTREIAQQIVTNGYEIIQLLQGQFGDTRDKIRQIAKTLRNNGAAIDEEPTLSQINNVLGNMFAGYSYGGIVLPDTPPDSKLTTDNYIFYIALTPGTYTNYGGYTLGRDDVAIITWTAQHWAYTKLDLQKTNVFDVMPDANAANDGLIAQYAGETTDEFIHGWFYEVVYDADTDTYNWQRLAIQAEIDIDTELDDTSTNPVENRAVTERLNLIISKVAVAPTYTEPALAIKSGNANQGNVTVEMGADWSKELTAVFTRNDAGALNGGSFDGTDFTAEELTAGSKTMTVELSNIDMKQTISAEVRYDAGALKNNNFDIPDDRGKIAAGTISKSFTITPELHYFYGAVADDWTITSANVRALTNARPGNITLATGTTYKKFVVAIPDDKSISQVNDTTAMNATITGEYQLQGTTHTIKDAGDNDRTYKVYIMTMGVTYDTSHSHSITIS